MKKQEVLTIWQTHFEKHLNTQFPHDEDALSELDSDMNVEEFSPITQTEVANAVKQLKNRKSPGIDGITAELYQKWWYNDGKDTGKTFQPSYRIRGTSQRLVKNDGYPNT